MRNTTKHGPPDSARAPGRIQQLLFGTAGRRIEQPSRRGGGTPAAHSGGGLPHAHGKSPRRRRRRRLKR